MMKRKLMALLVTAMMLTTMLPMAALAEGNEGAPAHQGHYECTHQCGDGSCSYAEAVEGREGVEGSPCDFTCTEELEEGEECTCSHTCGDGSCSYQEAVEPVEAVEGVACDHDCASDGCAWVCDDSCPACAGEGKVEEENTPEEPKQPEANGALGSIHNATPVLLQETQTEAFLTIDEGSIEISLQNGDQSQSEGYHLVQKNKNGGIVQDITLSPGAPVTISQNSMDTIFENQIIVAAGVTGLDLTIENLNLKAPWSGNWMDGSPITIGNGADISLTLSGENTLKTSHYGAGIALASKATIAIDGDGSLYAGDKDAYAAGIGTFNTSSDPDSYATIHIKGGYIQATGGPTCAAIGGIGSSSSCDGGNIIVDGGTVEATATHNGAAIGGSYYGIAGTKTGNGGNITINGGTVLAVAQNGGAAIGGGYNGGAGQIHIGAGANVTAISNTAAAAIGRGSSCKSTEVGSITIAAGAQITAHSNGLNSRNKYSFAIDTDIPCDIDTSILNARFSFIGEQYYNEEIGKVMTSGFRSPLPINVVNRTTNEMLPLTLPAQCHAFATTVNGAASDYMVQNGAEGKQWSIPVIR